MKKRIGVLTGGGDVPGLNATIKTVVRHVERAGSEVVGLRRGWESLVNIHPEAGAANDVWLKRLDRETTRSIDRFGGTVLHSSRLNPSILLPSQVPEHLRVDSAEPIDGTPHVLAVIEHLELDALIAIGGDGTLSYAQRLHQEGVPVIAVPKTMDNDVFGTDYCIGFSTAVSRAVGYINNLRTAAGSHERLLIVEIFGRYSGEPCLMASFLADADRCLLAEVPFDFDRVAALLEADKANSPSNYAVLAVAEGAYPLGGAPLERGPADAVGHRKLGGIGEVIAEKLEREHGADPLTQVLGYLIRSGAPDSVDLLVAKNFGTLAADLVLAGKKGLLVAVVGGRYTAVSIERLSEGKRQVDVERFYDIDGYRPDIRDVASLPMFLH